MAASKKTTTKKGSKTTAKKPTAAEISSRRQLYAIGFFAAGIIFLAMTLIKGESLWESMHYALFGLFGWCAYLIGPVFIYLAVMNTMEKPTFSTSAQGYESLALIILLSGITTVFSENMVLEGSVFQKIGQLYTYGKDLTGGGVLSSVYGLTAMALMGRLAAIIVGLVLIVVVLMLMNGSGIVGRLENLPLFFRRMKQLLRTGGCILMDSSDLRYLFEEEDGSFSIDLAAGYYGEVDFQMQYGSMKGEPFDWLYIDFQTLSYYAAENGFCAELVMEGDHYDYLARLSLRG